jgi:DNA-binding response OmpR family regulator
MKVQTCKYDLIILDSMMPGGSGADFMREVIERGIILPPVLMMPSKGDYDLRLNALRLGVSEFLVKPVEPEELRRAVEKLISAKLIP